MHQVRREEDYSFEEQYINHRNNYINEYNNVMII
jgi:hypothetical protein